MPYNGCIKRVKNKDMSRIGNFTETMGEPNKDEPKINSFLYRVIWRNWILPISITLILGTALKLLFIAMGWNEFLAGYYTCIGWFISHRISSI